MAEPMYGHILYQKDTENIIYGLGQIDIHAEKKCNYLYNFNLNTKQTFIFHFNLDNDLSKYNCQSDLIIRLKDDILIYGGYSLITQNTSDYTGRLLELEKDIFKPNTMYTNKFHNSKQHNKFK